MSERMGDLSYRMSLAEHTMDLYGKIHEQILRPEINYSTGKYPKVQIDGKKLSPTFIDNLVQSCTELYNHIDSIVETLKLTVPDVYEENKGLVKTKIIGGAFDEHELVAFKLPQYSSDYGQVHAPTTDKLPLGIKSVIDLLVQTAENMEAGHRVESDECFLTAKVSFCSLRAALTQFLTRFNYVMMYPHRIVLDRMVLETGLRKHGMDKVVGYVQSAEEHFNEQKYVEFCAISRDALHEAIKNICLIIEGVEHGFSNNCRRLEEIGFLKSTVLKQMKEFSGSLSAGGSHPPKEKMSDDEAKFLLDSLYGFLGLIVLRLSSFKRTKSMLKQGL